MTRTTSTIPTALLLLSVCHLLSASGGSQTQSKTVTPGEYATLPCSAPSSVSISAVEWRRQDSDKYVYLNRDGNVDTNDQDPSFKGRVNVTDSGIRNGDLSLILKNVSIRDTGTYECRYRGSETRRRRFIIPDKPISIIQLHIETPQSAGGHSGHVGLAVGLSVGALALVVAGIVIYGKRRGFIEQMSY